MSNLASPEPKRQSLTNVHYCTGVHSSLEGAVAVTPAVSAPTDREAAGVGGLTLCGRAAPSGVEAPLVWRPALREGGAACSGVWGQSPHLGRVAGALLETDEKCLQSCVNVEEFADRLWEGRGS